MWKKALCLLWCEAGYGCLVVDWWRRRYIVDGMGLGPGKTGVPNEESSAETCA